ncbi:MAG: polysaccharide deacetylase family protein [Actinobacteria bacterium]|nr:polysaccharide deacetylase family protein [Actinomycetota bacterium]
MTDGVRLSGRSSILVGIGALVVSCALAAGLAPAAQASVPPVASLPMAVAQPLPPVVYQVKTKDPVFFITIDDDSFKQSAAARYVTAHKIPVTVFLTNSEVDNRWSFFKAMGKFDSVQNHSMTHKPLGRDGTDRRFEICQTQKVYQNRFGVRPWLLRPPYGDGWFSRRWAAPAIRQTAATCGIRYIVLWNIVVLKDGRVLFVQDLKFEPGDIVLLHFEGDLKSNIQRIIAMYARHGIKPAPLSRYLSDAS